jgi:hypothetical protein
MSTAALSRTLKSITVSKIVELEKQRKSFATRKKEILEAAEKAELNKRRKVLELLQQVEKLDLPSSSGVSLHNMKRWLHQSQFDDSIPEGMLEGFDERLRSQLDVQTRRLDLADLYSRLLREWLNSSNSEAETDLAVDDTMSLDGSFELVDKDRLRSLCEKFEAVVFSPLDSNEVQIDNYLASLFDGDYGAKALERLRNKTGEMAQIMLKNTSPFDDQSLRWCLKGLLANDLLSDEKKTILQEFLQDEVARGEICDVLNMKYRQGIHNWSWDAGDEGMLVEPRRQLNGKWRIMMDEDVLQAIFLHYVGVTWSVAMKTILSELLRYTRLWKQKTNVPQEETDKRRYYLGDWHGEGRDSSVEHERQRVYREDFFMSQLPSSVYEGAGGYEDDEPIGESGKKSPKEIKQQLLRQLATEVQLRQCLDGEAAVVQSDFQWFATSISHSTIIAVLRFLGMPEKWIALFKTFLEAPLNLSPVSDGPGSHQVRLRKRGIPMAHALEKFLGELVLFFIDLAVNQETGTLLYRFHDDLWLCGKPRDCAKAWRSMEQFSMIMGLEFNRKKTGSVYLTRDESSRDPDIVAVLPEGLVSVGFLILDQTGHWTINQQDVDAHVTQLQKQLSQCSSVLSWVQTWNSCIGRFFGHSLGEPANCFGQAHVDSILETHKQMQRYLFNGEDGNGNSVTDHLKRIIASRFGITDIPDAFIFLPEHLGGLGVRNPFISSFLVRDQICKDPSIRLAEFLKKEKQAYEDAKRDFEDMGEMGRRRRFRSLYTNEYGEAVKMVIAEQDVDTFFSMEEYTHARESLSLALCFAYKDLMRVPESKEIVMSRNVTDELANHALLQPELCLDDMEPEMKWLLQLHSEELFAKCGGLSIVDKNLLPLGILTILRKRKVGWQMVL